MDGMNFAHRWKTPAKRVGIFIFVIFVHGMILYALTTEHARKVVKVAEVIHQPVEVRIIAETKPVPEETPPPGMRQRPPKSASKPRPFVPAPKRPARKPAAKHNAPLAAPSTAPPSAPAPSISTREPTVRAPATAVETVPVPHVPIRTAPVVDPRFCGKPEYPSASRRFEESGAVVLNFLIDADGRVVQSKIESSSGYERLDEAARRALSLCRFKPGTVDGKPEKSWHTLKYVWQLGE
ncbi:MAG: energy transducer TonB [Burkholderiaceae bacterium]|nr:energy transducer TonB [Burkholderiaceae bacterium]